MKRDIKSKYWREFCDTIEWKYNCAILTIRHQWVIFKQWINKSFHHIEDEEETVELMEW